MIMIPNKTPNFRDYQVEAYKSLWNHENESTILQLPTGAGKGLIISKLIIDCVSKAKSVLVIVPTIELLDNIYDRLMAYCPFLRPMVGRLGTGRGKDINFPVVIGVYKSIASRLDQDLPHFHVVISDECHHAASKSWSDVLRNYDQSWHIGFTATPSRLDGKSLQGLYQVLIESKPVQWFIDNGYLCDYVLRTHPVEFKSKKGYDDLADQQKYFDRKSIIGDAIREWETYALGKKTIFFCTGIEHAKHVMNDFNDYFNGRYTFGYIGSDMSFNERAKVLDDYKSGKLTGLTNVSIVTEGVDIPDVSCISGLRYTQSLSLYLQMVGRALRPKKDGSKAIILDHAGNALTHGSPSFDHEWTLDTEETIAGCSKINCPLCELPVISYAKLATYGETGITIKCPNCSTVHHYQHTKEERGQRSSSPSIDSTKELEDFNIDPITFRIAKIINSKALQQKKVNQIVKLKCGLATKIEALRSIGIKDDMIETYLGINDSYSSDNYPNFANYPDLLGI